MWINQCFATVCSKRLLRNLWKWPQTVGSFITSNSELLTSSFSEKSSKTPRRLLLYCILLLPKKSCHLPNKNVVSGLHQRPPLLDPRKERKSKAWVEFVCLRIPLTIVFDASLNYVSGSPLVQMGPLLGYLFITTCIAAQKESWRKKDRWELGKGNGSVCHTWIQTSTCRRMTNDKEKGSKTRPLTVNQQ